MKAPAVDLHSLTSAQALIEIAGAGTLEAALIDELKFDKEYQRELRADAVQDMAGKWNPKVAGAIVVNRRPNSHLYVIDGQHRTAAAKTAGETHILAFVFENLTRTQEAAMRVDGNVRQADSPQERFRAKLASGDPESKAVMEVCERYGTKINFYPHAGSGIDCVSTVEQIYRKDEGELLDATFSVIRRAWGDVSAKHARADVLKGISHLLEVNADEVDTARLTDLLQQEGTVGLNMKANSHQATWGGSGPTNWYRALVEVYNVGLPQRARIHPRIKGRP